MGCSDLLDDDGAASHVVRHGREPECQKDGWKHGCSSLAHIISPLASSASRPGPLPGPELLSQLCWFAHVNSPNHLPVDFRHPGTEQTTAPKLDRPLRHDARATRKTELLH